MSFALNEVEATAKKATRGAAYTWGLAEEASKATRWLCAQGMDGCAALAGLLRKTDRATDMAPVSLDGNWHGASGRLCALIAGASLSDCAYRLPQGEIHMENVIAPQLLIPFAAAAARQLGQPVTIGWGDVEIATDGSRLDVADMPTTAIAEIVTVRLGGQIGQPVAQHSRATPDVNDWTYLNELAGRTYAPATEESRLKGAGAGLSDND
ncbi:DUF3726 domain-containing protein (plasmid) [Rhodobacteraceae bacterium M382]|nr:DUF3726 domain-containing protein [Rhodobacteraceae bacterium M382]